MHLNFQFDDPQYFGSKGVIIFAVSQCQISGIFTSGDSVVIASSVKTRARHNFLNYMKTVLRGST